jgi:hypothetical protein
MKAPKIFPMCPAPITKKEFSYRKKPYWRLKARTTSKIKIPRVFEINPFLIGKKITECTVSVGNLSSISNYSIESMVSLLSRMGTLLVRLHDREVNLLLIQNIF